MKVAGVIVAGGKSTRMGGREKAFVELNGKPLLAHVIARLGPQVQALAINANGDATRFDAFQLPVIADMSKEVATPLAGLEAALHWASAQGAEQVLTVPSDAPLLPPDLAQRLSAAGAPAMARSADQDHYLTALWPTSIADVLSAAVRAGLRPVKAWAAHCNARPVMWEVREFDPFANINTPDELAQIAAHMEKTNA